MNRYRSLVLLLPFFFALSSVRGHAQESLPLQEGTHGKRSITAMRTELPVVLDGIPDEPAWQQAPVSLGFVQKDPHEGEPSTERTEFRILYTETTLYIGIICYDSGAEGIRATERRRDNELVNDDTVSIVLDTFHDHRNAFLFRTNPLGAQYDALITDEGNDLNENWDETWDVVSQINPAGWTVEFAIPFKSLRLSEDAVQRWGIDLERVIRRKNEQAYWNGFHRGFNLENLSQAGHLEGLENIETGLRLRVKPFTVAGFQHSANPDDSTFRNTSDIGIEVMKYRITPGLTADVTWNTDFAETEVDDQQVDLERFPLFFPEKREFFQEGAGIFDFGIANQEGRRELRLFHSRRIGLSPRRQEVPILAGGRITGKLQGFTLGMLNVQTEALPSENIPVSNYSVLRVKRDVLSRSTVGGFLLNREMGGNSDYNRIYGLDGKFVFRRYLTLDGFLAKSAEPGVNDNWVVSAKAKWDSDFLQTGMEYFSIDPNFRNDLGFIRRTDVRRFSPFFAVSPRPNIRGVRQMLFSARWDTLFDHNNRLIRRVDHYVVTMTFQSGDHIRSTPLHYNFDRVEEPFEISPGVTVPAGDYTWGVWSVSFRANPGRTLSGRIAFTQRYNYYGGNIYVWGIAPVLKLTEDLSFIVDYDINVGTLPGGSFTDHTVNTRINYNFNNQWLTSTTLQYNNTDSFLGFNFRLNYIFRPGDDFFLVYNEGRRALFEEIDNVERRVTGVFDGQRDRSLQLKLTYSFDF
ncbi:MAG: carbohydrate binding family 9 domain-containing protein [Acidobacteria bacterium]|nr:carbohydrate binding family 9 domain-containing protein [Acidobacteriota bacterium]